VSSPPAETSTAAAGITACSENIHSASNGGQGVNGTAGDHIRARRDVLDEELHQLQRIQERADVVQLDDHRSNQ